MVGDYRYGAAGHRALPIFKSLRHIEQLLEEGFAGFFDGGFIVFADGILDPLAEGLGLDGVVAFGAFADLSDDAFAVAGFEGEDLRGERKIPADHAAVKDEVADDLAARKLQAAGGGIQNGELVLTEGD